VRISGVDLYADFITKLIADAALQAMATKTMVSIGAF
jgi:hypothetical protein